MKKIRTYKMKKNKRFLFKWIYMERNFSEEEEEMLNVICEEPNSIKMTL